MLTRKSKLWNKAFGEDTEPTISKVHEERFKDFGHHISRQEILAVGTGNKWKNKKDSIKKAIPGAAIGIENKRKRKNDEEGQEEVGLQHFNSEPEPATDYDTFVLDFFGI